MRALAHDPLIGDKSTPIRSTAYQLRDNCHQYGLFTVGSIIKTFQLLFTLLVIQTQNANALTSTSSTQQRLPLHLIHRLLYIFYSTKCQLTCPSKELILEPNHSK